MTKKFWFTHVAVVCMGLMLVLGTSAQAQSPFGGGWTLNSDMSNLNFQSVKKETVVESSGFATFEGTIDEAGATKVTVLLDSVDTKIDLRNVRMRFLFFETFKFPNAIITAQLDPNTLADLATVRRKQILLDYAVSLHGVSKSYQSEVTATLLSNDMVSVASAKPVTIPVTDFNLVEGLGKLEDAASVAIAPYATVSFDWVFARNTTTAAVAPAAPTKPQNVALETEGNFDLEACKGRFEILSRTGNIYFKSGSSRLDNKSKPLLDSLAKIMLRCPGMNVAVEGHTDNVGTSRNNLRLSDDRANAVVTYLVTQGLQSDTMVAQGYGETQPIATNDTKKGRWDNRRIAFKVLEN